MNERLKELRVELGLNQETFGQKLGLSKSAISNMESGRYNITETIILTICSIFNTNEKWLRSGTGEMFNKKDYAILDELIANDPRYHLDEIDMKILQAYIDMPPKLRSILKSKIVEIAKQIKGDE